jgi:hypothetical protein
MAVELARLALPRANWDEMLVGVGQQVVVALQQRADQKGVCLAPDFGKRVSASFAASMPYEEAIQFQAELLQKKFTQAELNDILAFYRSPTGAKAIRLMPEVMNEGMVWGQSLVQRRAGDIEAEVKSLIRPCEGTAPAADKR